MDDGNDLSTSVRDNGTRMTKDQVITEQMEIIIAILRRLEGKIVVTKQELRDAHDYTFAINYVADSDRVEIEVLSLEQGNQEVAEFLARGQGL